MAKDETYRKLIHTSQWQRLRRAVLAASPCCETCREAGRIAAAVEVHHIRPVEEALTTADMAQRMYDPNNLRALCHDCHVKAHIEMGRSGKEATRRLNEKKVEEFAGRYFTETPGGVFEKGEGASKPRPHFRPGAD